MPVLGGQGLSPAPLGLYLAGSLGGRFALDSEIIDFNPEFGEDRATGQVRGESLMLNAVYRFVPGRAIRPYLGGGAGVVRADYDVAVGLRYAP